MGRDSESVLKQVKNLLHEYGTGSDIINMRAGNGTTPLHDAVYQDYREIAEILIAHGAKVNAQGDNGCTPLHNAVDHENKWMTELLIKNGANLLIENAWGHTPSYDGSDDMKRFLIDLNNHPKQTLKQTLSTEQVSVPTAAKGESYALSDEYTYENDLSISIVNLALMKNKGR